MDGEDIHAAILQMRKMLLNLDGWLVKATANAQARAFDPGVLLGIRLVPDQVPLVRHVQIACDRVKFAAARLALKQAPRHPDTEQTIHEVHARIGTCVGYLETFVLADFEDAASRMVELPFLDGKMMRGSEYLTELAQPGFYFHVTTAYAILRHSGVELSMREFIGAANIHTN